MCSAWLQYLQLTQENSHFFFIKNKLIACTCTYTPFKYKVMGYIGITMFIILVSDCCLSIVADPENQKRGWMVALQWFPVFLYDIYVSTFLTKRRVGGGKGVPCGSAYGLPRYCTFHIVFHSWMDFN